MEYELLQRTRGKKELALAVVLGNVSMGIKARRALEIFYILFFFTPFSPFYIASGDVPRIEFISPLLSRE